MVHALAILLPYHHDSVAITARKCSHY